MSDRPDLPDSAAVLASHGGSGSQATDSTQGLPQPPIADGGDHPLQDASTGLSPDQSAEVQAQKKIAQTDAIFERLREVHAEADAADDVLRLSLDSKAAVKIGLFSRGGCSWVKVKASDHDFKPQATLTPFGIVLPRYQDLFLYLVRSKVTSDFMVDILESWSCGGLACGLVFRRCGHL